MIAALAGTLVPGMGFAQTVTCDASNGSPDGTTTFNSLFAACASFHTGGTNVADGAANVINCVGVLSLVDGGPGVGGTNSSAQAGKLDLTEVMMADTLTFNGPATIILDSNVPTTDDGSICFNFSAAPGGTRAVTFNDLTFLPDAATVVGDPEDGFQHGGAVDANYEGLVVTFNDCVLTSNNGSNAPSANTGTAGPDVGDKPCADDWIFVNGDPGGIGTDLILNGTIVTHAEDDGIIAGGKRMQLRNSVTNRTRIVYNASGRGIQHFNAQLDIVGTAARPIDISYNGINLAADTTGGEGIVNLTPGAFVASTISYVDFVGNAEAITWIGTGIQEAPLNFDHCTFAFNRSAFQGGGINMVSDTAATGPHTIDQCTFHNQTDDSGSPVEEAIAWGEGADTTNNDLVITNTIFSGAGDTAIRTPNTAPVSGGTVNVSFSALVTAGPDALATTLVDAPALVTLGTGVIGADPDYVTSTLVDFQANDPGFLNVNGSAYQAAGTAGSPLAGSKSYVGVMGVEDWALFSE